MKMSNVVVFAMNRDLLLVLLFFCDGDIIAASGLARARLNVRANCVPYSKSLRITS